MQEKGSAKKKKPSIDPGYNYSNMSGVGNSTGINFNSTGKQYISLNSPKFTPSTNMAMKVNYKGQAPQTTTNMGQKKIFISK